MNKIKFFYNGKIRAFWDSESCGYYFFIRDIFSLLDVDFDENIINLHIDDIKTFKVSYDDGGEDIIDVADSFGVLNIIQSMSSPKAMEIKRWLAQVGSERIDEIAEPEIAVERAINNFKMRGYSEEWIKQRLSSTTLNRKFLSDDIIHISDNVCDYAESEIKNPYENMTNMELILNSLAEASLREMMNLNPIDLIK